MHETTDKDPKNADTSNILLKRIRILKTGLFGVERYLDMRVPENRLLFEKIAQPGTELKLVRVHNDPYNPYRINVYSDKGQYLGRVTKDKGQTAAMLMDAGLEVIAIVNESLPVHDSDYNLGKKDDPDNPGWSEASRFASDHSQCNLPFFIYLVDE